MSELTSLGQFVHLSPSENTALLHILLNGPAYAYDLAYHPTDKIEMINGLMVEKKWVFNTEKTANTALNGLARRRLLEKKEVNGDLGGNRGRKRKYYYLTLSGLFLGLSILDEEKEVKNKIDVIVRIWKNLLPALFGRWKQFEEAGLHDCVVSLLKHSIMVWFHEWFLFVRSQYREWKGDVEVNPDFDPDFFLKTIAHTLIINPFRDNSLYLGCGLADCSRLQHPKEHSIGCLVEHDKILHLCPELLEIYKELSKDFEESTGESLKHYTIKRQIGEMLNQPDVDWSEISQLELLIAKYRSLVPPNYAKAG
jgi:hypothetical protein